MALTPAQLHHNTLVDFEIKMAEREHQHREEEARIKNEWFRKTYPDAPEGLKSVYGINMIPRRRVIAFYYAE
jgi:hypothetical protein